MNTNERRYIGLDATGEMHGVAYRRMLALRRLVFRGMLTQIDTNEYQ